LFDKDCDGRIATSELGPVLRSVGLNPTEEEISELVHYYDKNRECVTIRK
jgi:calmodulin